MLPAMQNSQDLSLNTSLEISAYEPSAPTAPVLAWAVKTLRACYPETNPAIFDVILNRIKENQWGDKRIKDAINYLIDNHIYKSINPANVMSFDKKKKLYTYNQKIDMINKGFKWDDFELVVIEGKRLWALKHG
jgi:hypothetical protein